MNRQFILRRVAPVAGALALGAGAGAGIYAGVNGGSSSPTPRTSTLVTTAQQASVTQTVSSLTQLYKDVTPGVVDITVVSSSSSGFQFGGQQQTQAEGSGFVYDTKGDIITNAHVVDGASSIKVRFQDGKTVKATLVGSDDSTDTAVIKVDVSSSARRASGQCNKRNGAFL